MIWQYFSLTHGKAFPRIVQELVTLPVIVILDLEDSVGDPFGDFSATAKAKETARNHLRTILRNPALLLPPERIAVRINSRLSPFVEDDIKALITLADTGIPQLTVVQPKVNSTECLQWLGAKLSPSWGNRIRIAPLIETVDGVRHLPQIAASLSGTRTPFHIGLFDLQFEQGQFPFVEPFSASWHALHAKFGTILTAAGCRMVCSPNVYLKGETLGEIRRLLDSQTKDSPDLASLSLGQTLGYLGMSPHNTEAGDAMPEDPLELARFLVDTYEAGAKPGKRLVVYKRFRLISPHEYRMAKDYLANHKPPQS